MFFVWNALSDDLQLAVAHEALCRVALLFARQSELLAEEIDDGHVPDCGGAEALRLFAAIIRREAATEDCAGHA